MTKEERRAMRLERKQNAKEAKEKNRENCGTLKEQYANLWFIYKFIFRTSPKLVFIRIPLLMLQTVQTMVSIFFVREIINELTEGKSVRRVIVLAGAMALIAFALNTFAAFLGRRDSIEGDRFNFKVQKYLAESVMEMSYETIENPDMQNYVRMAQYNRFGIALQYTTAVVSGIFNLIGVGAIVFTLNPTVILIIAVTSTVRFLLERYQRNFPRLFSMRRIQYLRNNDYSLGLMRDIKFGKEIRIADIGDWLAGFAEETWRDKLFPIDREFTRKYLGFGNINSILGAVQDILVYTVLALEVIFSAMTVGDFSMYLTAANTFSGAIMGVATNYSYLMLETTWYIKDYRRCLDLVKKQREEGGKTHIGVPANAKIEFRDVSFKYPDTDNIVLSHVNITIEAGEALSVVGINGSGKTTFVKLLCRLYEPTEGDIFINGVNSKDIPLTEYYRLLGVVFQDFSLFNFTVGENITMSTEHDEERLRESIKKSGLESRIETLPHGTDTYMFKEFEPDGIELSGGEGQKVAIARAIYKEAPIVVFDEPTSALDPIAEYNIYRNFYDLAEQRTAIYISHRLSSTRFTDRTAVFANNTIAEYGTHDELMRIEDGIYRKLFLMQAQYYRE